MRRAFLYPGRLVSRAVSHGSGAGAGVDRAQRAGFFALNCVRVRLRMLAGGQVATGGRRCVVEEDAKSRLRRVIGDEGVEKLEGSCVAVFGVGGVGSSCAEALAPRRGGGR